MTRETPPDLVPAETTATNPSWHSFFSEKDGKFFFFDPVQNVSTWLLPNENKGEDVQEDNGPGGHQERIATATTFDTSAEKNKKIPKTKSCGLEIDERTSQGTTSSTLDDLKQRFQKRAKEIQEIFQTAGENPYPWALLGIAAILIVIKLFTISRYLLPVFLQGRPLMQDHQQPQDILRRVEESFQKMIGDEQEPFLPPEMATKQASGSVQISVLQGQEILKRVELARNSADMEGPLGSWSKMKNAAKDVEEFIIL
jgi:hypothetical protein